VNHWKNAMLSAFLSWRRGNSKLKFQEVLLFNNAFNMMWSKSTLRGEILSLANSSFDKNSTVKQFMKVQDAVLKVTLKLILVFCLIPLYFNPHRKWNKYFHVVDSKITERFFIQLYICIKSAVSIDVYSQWISWMVQIWRLRGGQLCVTPVIVISL